MPFPENLHLFCRVVDNYGDIGVCWRLARELASEHHVRTTLWVDDLASFQRICAAIDPLRDIQQANGVEVRRWGDVFLPLPPADVADVVIEAFACELPPAYVEAMAAREDRPVWINLEYLSAEPWVEDCHGMPSHHPSLPLTKYFFFPGFSERTGGLLAENGLSQMRAGFQDDPQAVSGFLAGLGVTPAPGVRKISLFCYQHAPVETLFRAMQAGAEPLLCMVPEGVASAAVATFLGQDAVRGANATRGALTVHVMPFVDQRDYDKLLWACDLNFVRGEDSFVRAQWAARPFVWHIYPQDEGAHWKKLCAFLARYEAASPKAAAGPMTATWLAWNGEGDLAHQWPSFMSTLPLLAEHAPGWAERLFANGDLASNLLQFARKIG